MKPDYTMSEHLAWVQWWAFPWRSAHGSWEFLNKYPEVERLSLNNASAICTITGIAPCLPPEPHPTVLRLALASVKQFDLMVMLIQNTFAPLASFSRDEPHSEWCMHLSKALPPGMLPSGEDPLQLLRTWVEPAAWQRLRLRAPCERVLEMEKKEFSLQNGHSQLNMLWQAINWRITSMNDDSMPSD